MRGKREGEVLGRGEGFGMGRRYGSSERSCIWEKWG